MNITNYRFLTTETNLKALYTFCLISKAISSEFIDFCLQLFFFWKKEKQHSQNLSLFENESTFQKKNHILKMKAQ